MTSLSPSLQLVLIDKAKFSKNILLKGFTLVELMVVIVIVGILSAVALPNFLNQTSKAKGTEATTKLSALLKQAQAEALYDTTAAAVTTMNATGGPVLTATGTGDWTYNLSAGGTDHVLITASPTENKGAVGITNFQGCVDVKTGAVEIKQEAAAYTDC